MEAVAAAAAAVDEVLLPLQASPPRRVALVGVKMKEMQCVFPVYVAEANWLACFEAYLQ